MNVGQILSAAASVGTEIALDGAEIAAGGTMLVPFEPQVASIAGKPVYLMMYLSTDKQTDGPSPVATTAPVAQPFQPNK